MSLSSYLIFPRVRFSVSGDGTASQKWYQHAPLSSPSSPAGNHDGEGGLWHLGDARRSRTRRPRRRWTRTRRSGGPASTAKRVQTPPRKGGRRHWVLQPSGGGEGHTCASRRRPGGRRRCHLNPLSAPLHVRAPSPTQLGSTLGLLQTEKQIWRACAQGLQVSKILRPRKRRDSRDQLRSLHARPCHARLRRRLRRPVLGRAADASFVRHAARRQGRAAHPAPLTPSAAVQSRRRPRHISPPPQASAAARRPATRRRRSAPIDAESHTRVLSQSVSQCYTRRGLGALTRC